MKINKSSRLEIRLTNEEKKKIEAKAKALSMTVSNYMRTKALN